MTRSQIEARVMRHLEHVEEDNFVEIKGGWPDAAQKARQIAGSANAAYGEEIIWIFGIDEKRKAPVDLTDNDFETWFAEAQSAFDGPYPEATTAWIDVGTVRVLAVAFRTDQAPYVIKNPKNPHDQRDIPWREGSRTRSAYRHEIMRLLARRVSFPSIEVLALQVGWDPPAHADSSINVRLSLVASLLLESTFDAPLSLAKHRCQAFVELEPELFSCTQMSAELESSVTGVVKNEAGLALPTIATFQIYFNNLGDTTLANVIMSKMARIRVILGFGAPIGRCEFSVSAPRNSDRFLIRNTDVSVVPWSRET